jgi:hypothetical protein
VSNPEPYNRRVPVAFGHNPSDDRYVSLTTVRLFATTVYVVGVVNGTGRLADPHSLLATADLSRARRHANKVLMSAGGPAEPPEVDPAPPKPKPAWLVRKQASMNGAAS